MNHRLSVFTVIAFFLIAEFGTRVQGKVFLIFPPKILDYHRSLGFIQVSLLHQNNRIGPRVSVRNTGSIFSTPSLKHNSLAQAKSCLDLGYRWMILAIWQPIDTSATFMQRLYYVY